MLLQRFTVKPHHLDDYLALWPQEVALRREHGFVLHRAFVETDAEPKLTWLSSAPAGPDAAAALAADPRFVAVQAAMAPHVFRNLTIRPVEVERLTPGCAPGQLAIMRRYAIVGAWEEFLALWRRIVVVRERHGFPCLFAVADRERDLFTWAFGFDGAWADVGAAQRPYYHDPERVALRGVFDYMADYSIHPARQLPVPAA